MNGSAGSAWEYENHRSGDRGGDTAEQWQCTWCPRLAHLKGKMLSHMYFTCFKNERNDELTGSTEAWWRGVESQEKLRHKGVPGNLSECWVSRGVGQWPLVDWRWQWPGTGWRGGWRRVFPQSRGQKAFCVTLHRYFPQNLAQCLAYRRCEYMFE